MNLAAQFKDNCDFGLLTHIHSHPTHQLLQDVNRALSCMVHQGAVAADEQSGDASGLRSPMPVRFMRKVAKEQRNPFYQWPPACVPASAPPTIKDRQ